MNSRVKAFLTHLLECFTNFHSISHNCLTTFLLGVAFVRLCLCWTANKGQDGLLLLCQKNCFINPSQP
jgi:hypothetical protein